MRLGDCYATLNGDIGEVVMATSLEDEIDEIQRPEEPLILCMLKFSNGDYEWWLSTQLEEAENPQTNLFKEEVE